MATKRMLIDASHAEETRVLVVNGNRLEDFDVEVETRRPLKGNIYLAKVTRVEPSLQAAFIDYGGNRHGFLPLKDIAREYFAIPPNKIRGRINIKDAVKEGQEIIVLEDRVAPEALPVHPFEAVSLTVEKGRVDDEHIWDFIYGFRLVDPKKMTYELPNFSFYYLIRDLGENIEDAEVQQIDGGQGLVRYITSITDEPLLDIRDTIELGTFAGRATVFRTLAWSVAPLPLLAWLVLLVRSARKPKIVSLEKQQEADELARIEAQIPVPPSIWEARRAVNREVSLLRRLPADAAAEHRLALERDLVLVLRDYLRADLPDQAKDGIT